jgi:hypothetical protein
MPKFERMFTLGMLAAILYTVLDTPVLNQILLVMVIAAVSLVASRWL